MTQFFTELADQVPEYVPGDLGRSMGEPVAGGPPTSVLGDLVRIRLSDTAAWPVNPATAAAALASVARAKGGAA